MSDLEPRDPAGRPRSSLRDSVRGSVPGGEVPGGEVPGAEARRPVEVPLRGYLQIAKRIQGNIAQKNLPVVAAGIAFFALLGIFPGLTALVGLYGLLANPQEIQEILLLLEDVLPREALGILAEQLERLLATPASGLGLGTLVSLLILLWSASKGTLTLISAVNLVYREVETRSFLRLRGLALLLTLGGLVFFAVSVAGIALLPVALGRLSLGGAAQGTLESLRWPLLGLVILTGLALIYRLAPDRRSPKWRWVSPGGVISTLIWLVGSSLFSVYVSTFGNYSETYGSLGAVVVLLLWLYLSAFVVLLGAEINVETEHQTAVDSTVGPDRPLGERGAWSADHRPQDESPSSPKGEGEEGSEA